MRHPRPTPRRRSEAKDFAVAIALLRKSLKKDQGSFAARLGVGKRTLSHWECGHWLPSHKQRLHLLSSCLDLEPNLVVHLAKTLGLGNVPAVETMLEPHYAALDAEENGPAVVEAPPPPTPRATPDELRRAMDAVVRDAADTMNVSANDLRAAIGHAIAAMRELGATLDDTRDAVAVKPKTKKTTA